jgi:hypothetical protein
MTPRDTLDPGTTCGTSPGPRVRPARAAAWARWAGSLLAQRPSSLPRGPTAGCSPTPTPTSTATTTTTTTTTETRTAWAGSLAGGFPHWRETARGRGIRKGTGLAWGSPMPLRPPSPHRPPLAAAAEAAGTGAPSWAPSAHGSMGPRRRRANRPGVTGERPRPLDTFPVLAAACGRKCQVPLGALLSRVCLQTCGGMGARGLLL